MSKWLPPGHGGYTGASKPREDPLAPARGCVNGCLLSVLITLAMIAIIGLIVLTAVQHH